MGNSRMALIRHPNTLVDWYRSDSPAHLLPFHSPAPVLAHECILST